MKINHNISALMANNALQKTNRDLDKSLEKLSSGYRINRAADDAAGMAISQKMHTQIAGLEQASRNAADGISVIQTAEGAMSEVGSMLQRMRELSVQSANDTLTLEDRKAIQKEVDQLRAEIDRISETTEFNTKTLLDGSADRKSYSNNIEVELIFLTDDVASKDYSMAITTEGTKATLVGGTFDVGFTGIITDDMAGEVNINGLEVEIVSGETISSVYEKLRELCTNVNVDVQPVDGSGADTTIELAQSFSFTTMADGKSQSIEISCNNQDLSKALGLDSAVATSGTDAVVVLGTGFTNTSTYLADGNSITVSDSDGFRMKLQLSEGAAGSTAKITVLDAGYISLQVGANEGQTVKISIPEISTKTLEIELLNVCTIEGAEAAISSLDEAIKQVSSVRAKLGAYQNRLEHAISSLDTSAENLTEALSRIEDADMAKEMARYTQLNVLTQAGTSMLAEANSRPQTVLSLLQG